MTGGKLVDDEVTGNVFPHTLVHRLIPLVSPVDQQSYLAGNNGNTVEVLYGGLVVSGDDMVRQAWLQRQEVLAEH